MKKSFKWLLSGAVLLAFSGNVSAWWGDDDWGGGYNDWPEWTPMYWMDEFFGDDDYWGGGPWNRGWGGGPGYGGWGGPWNSGWGNQSYYGYGPQYYSGYGYGYGYPNYGGYYGYPGNGYYQGYTYQAPATGYYAPAPETQQSHTLVQTPAVPQPQVEAGAATPSAQ